VRDADEILVFEAGGSSSAANIRICWRAMAVRDVGGEPALAAVEEMMAAE